MNHSFNIQIASKFGVEEAIILENIRFWIAKNKANGKYFYNGEYWTYNSVKAFSELFPYWSSRQIERILKSLESQGLILINNFNQSAYDRTKWYAITKKCYSIYANGEMDLHKKRNGNTENVEPIPDINTDINTNNKPYTNSGKNENEYQNLNQTRIEEKETECKTSPNEQKHSKFSIPLVSDIKLYCDERNNQIDADTFFDYYTANGWMVGKHKMKDWKAAVRTWEKNNINKNPIKKPYIYEKLF